MCVFGHLGHVFEFGKITVRGSAHHSNGPVDDVFCDPLRMIMDAMVVARSTPAISILKLAPSGSACPRLPGHIRPARGFLFSMKSLILFNTSLIGMVLYMKVLSFKC